MYLIVFNFIGLPNKVATEGFFCHPNYVEMEHLCITITGKNHKARQWFPTMQLMQLILFMLHKN